MPAVTLRYSDGKEIQVSSDPGETILAAAARAGAPLVHQCQGGSCGTCIAHLLEGETQTVPGRALALLESEARAGFRLTCSTSILSESAVLELSYPFSGSLHAAPKQFKAQVQELEWLSRSAIRLSLSLPPGDKFSFESGQYVRIRVPEGESWRAYSMATPPSKLPSIDFIIRYIENGAMSEWLKSRCGVGDWLDLEGPFGGFVLAEGTGPIIMVSGGTGLAPMMSMLDTLRIRRGPKAPILLCFGCNTEEDLFYQDELELRSFWMPNLTVRTAVMSSSPAQPDIQIGTAVSLIQQPDVAPETVAYLCGPPPMVEAARERLMEWNVAPRAIFSEQFRASEA